jgi:hypothetical protein
MPAVPTFEEIEATVQRMEAKWAASPQFAAYRDLRRRFEADLADPRDLALAKSAALMMVKQLEENF